VPQKSKKDKSTGADSSDSNSLKLSEAIGHTMLKNFNLIDKNQETIEYDNFYELEGSEYFSQFYF